MCHLANKFLMDYLIKRNTLGQNIFKMAAKNPRWLPKNTPLDVIQGEGVSGADLCKNCGFCDKSTKFGTKEAYYILIKLRYSTRRNFQNGRQKSKMAAKKYGKSEISAKL